MENDRSMMDARNHCSSIIWNVFTESVNTAYGDAQLSQRIRSYRGFSATVD